MHFTFRFFLKVKISGGVFGRPSGQKRMAVVANFLFVSFSPPPTLKAKRPVGVEGALFFFFFFFLYTHAKEEKGRVEASNLGFLSLSPLSSCLITDKQKSPLLYHGHIVGVPRPEIPSRLTHRVLSTNQPLLLLLPFIL